MSVYRSLLFAPGNHPRRVENALSLDADAVILDLEDACPIAEKKATRARVVAACQRPRKTLGYVRVNAMSSEFGYGDIVAVVQGGIDGILLPKVESADEIKTVDWVQWYDFSADPGGVLESEGHQRGSVESLSVTTGELEVEVGGAIERAKAGETLRYRCDRPHTIRNPSQMPAAATMVCILKAAAME